MKLKLRRKHSVVVTIGLAVAYLAAGSASVADEQNPVEFKRDVLPILQQHCFECHSEHESEGDFRLDSETALRQGGHTGALILGDSAESSELFLRLISEDPELRMPPKEFAPLEPDQVEILRDWIDAGAQWPESASAQAPATELPAASNWVGEQLEFLKQAIVQPRLDFLMYWLVPGIVLLVLIFFLQPGTQVSTAAPGIHRLGHNGISILQACLSVFDSWCLGFGRDFVVPIWDHQRIESRQKEVGRKRDTNEIDGKSFSSRRGLQSHGQTRSSHAPTASGRSLLPWQ